MAAHIWDMLNNSFIIQFYVDVLCWKPEPKTYVIFHFNKNNFQSVVNDNRYILFKRNMKHMLYLILPVHVPGTFPQ